MAALRHRRLIVIGVAILVLAVAVVLEDRPRPGPRNPPNIVVFVADDWSWPHAGVYGDKASRTPYFDRLADEGMLFTHAFSPSPSCTASRFSTLTGQYPHRLNEGANLQPRLTRSWLVYPELLQAAGYAVGSTRKGCNPGTLEGTGWQDDPAGERFPSLEFFLDSIPEGKPFCFWMGNRHPHRAYRQGVGVAAGMKLGDVEVPGFLPDTPEVRGDILDYLHSVSQFDYYVGRNVDILKQRGLAGNTIVVVTSDNGMPFPRAKANCYDYGVRVPLLIVWPKGVEAGQVYDGFVHLSDLAPTFLDAAGLEPPADMTAGTLMNVLTGRKESLFKKLTALIRGRHTKRDRVFLERERHSMGRGRRDGEEGYLSYPIRGVRTNDFLYLRNYRPDLWPACDPPGFRDIDLSPSRDAILSLKDSVDPTLKKLYDLACGKRPYEELYDIVSDPFQLNNLAEDPAYTSARKKLSSVVDKWMKRTGDPRFKKGDDDRWDYYGWYSSDTTLVPRRPDGTEP